MNKEHDEIIPKIAIVDDRKENLIAIKKILSPLTLDLYFAESGKEILSLSLDHDFAVILLDVQMPEMDGFEVASLLQSNDKTSHIPIIFVTAIDKEEKHVEKGHSLGAVDYLFKPIDPMILLSKVTVFCKLYCREKLLSSILNENEKMRK